MYMSMCVVCVYWCVCMYIFIYVCVRVFVFCLACERIDFDLSDGQYSMQCYYVSLD